MRPILFHKAMLATTALAALPLCGAAAQTQPQPDQAPGEIVVTAQKRAESVRDVPQSLIVVKGETLTSRGIQSTADLIGQFPGVSTFSFGGAGQTQINVRGITTGLDVSSAVATYLDDVPFGSGTTYSGLAQISLELGSFDVQRVELLRGPQGTLYGASSLGGLLKYVLAPVDMEKFGETIQLEGSASDRSRSYAVRGSINAPIVADRIALHVSALHAHDGGNVDDVATGATNADRYAKDALRATLELKPTEKLTLRGTALLQRLDRDGSSDVYYAIATGRPIYGDFKNNQPLASAFHERAQVYSFNGDYDLGFASLQATVGHQHLTAHYALDASEAYPALFAAFFPINQSAVANARKMNKTTAEVRLASSGHQKLEYIAGLYYTDETLLNTQQLYGALNGVRLPIDLGTFTIPSAYREYAAYGNVTYHVSPRLDATFGLRASHDRQSFSQGGTGLIATSNPGSSESDTTVTYLGTVRYHLSGANLLYVRAASGYRPGGPNLVASDPVTGRVIGASTFKPDTLWNYEIGAKLSPVSWLTADISAFYIDWKSIQINAVRNGIGVVANGGTARSDGVEFAITARPTPAWSASLTGAWMESKLTAPAPDVGGSDGERLPNTPHWSLNAATDYRVFKTEDLSGTVGASWRYLGKRTSGFNNSANSPQYILPSFNTVDLRAGLETRHVSLDFYVRNLLDKRGELSAITGFAFVGGPARVSVIQPRTFGLVLTSRY